MSLNERLNQIVRRTCVCERRSARRVDSIMRAAIQTRKQNVPTAIHWDRSSSPAAVVVPDNHLLANAVASSQTCVKIQFPSTRDMHIVHTALFDWVQCLSATRNEVGKNVWFPVSTSLVTAAGSRVRPSWCTVQLYSNCTRSHRVEVFDFWFNISARKPWDKRWMQKKNGALCTTFCVVCRAILCTKAKYNIYRV